MGTHTPRLGDVGQNLQGDLPKLSNYFQQNCLRICQALLCLSPSEVSFTMIFLSSLFLCCFFPPDPPPNLARVLEPSLLPSVFCSETSQMGLIPQEAALHGNQISADTARLPRRPGGPGRSFPGLRGSHGPDSVKAEQCRRRPRASPWGASHRWG